MHKSRESIDQQQKAEIERLTEQESHDFFNAAYNHIISKRQK